MIRPGNKMEQLSNNKMISCKKQNDANRIWWREIRTDIMVSAFTSLICILLVLAGCFGTGRYSLSEFAHVRLTSKVPTADQSNIRSNLDQHPIDERPVTNDDEFTSKSTKDLHSNHSFEWNSTIAANLRSRTLAYVPGNLIVNQNGLLLSEGLSSRLIATAGRQVEYTGRAGRSVPVFHRMPDAGATFPDTSSTNVGGWIYVSNSEMRDSGNKGGVGAITFNKNGQVIDYKMVLTNTRGNCGGGKTPWGAWISCEEYHSGRIWQVDPKGKIPPKKVILGAKPGEFESFAYDVRNKNIPRFFVTKDRIKSEITRFTPTNPNWNDPWNILSSPGVLDYLVLFPSTGASSGRYEWTKDFVRGIESATRFFPNCEGIDVRGNELYFISKVLKVLFTLNLDNGTYKRTSTVIGRFGGQPDQANHFSNVLYFSEDGGRPAGVHARTLAGRFYTLLESPTYTDETTGLAFSPDKKHLYVAYQDNGLLFDITRNDGNTFDAFTLDIKYS